MASKVKNPLDLINKHFDEMFNSLCDNMGDDIYDLVIEYKSDNDGTTIRRSWRDREEMLGKEQNEK